MTPIILSPELLRCPGMRFSFGGESFINYEYNNKHAPTMPKGNRKGPSKKADAKVAAGNTAPAAPPAPNKNETQAPKKKKK